MSFANRIEELNQIRLDIKQALIDKGIDVTGVPFIEYASKIDEISDVKLTGNATTGDVLSGKTFYNTDANEIQTGTLALNGNATTGDVLSGKTFYNTNADEIQTGTLALNGNAMTDDVLSGKTFYNTDANEIQTGTLALSGDAVASNVLSGKTFYNTDSKTKVTGTMTNQGAVTKTFTPSTSTQTYTIPAGYHNGSGKVTCNAYSLTETLLWTNSSPTTAIAANGAFATLSQSVSNFKFIKVVYRRLTSDSTTNMSIYSTTGQSYCGLYMGWGSNPYYHAVRGITFSGTAVHSIAVVTSASSGGYPYSATATMIPTHIYGIK